MNSSSAKEMSNYDCRDLLIFFFIFFIECSSSSFPPGHNSNLRNLNNLTITGQTELESN